ncbi:replication protein A 70 kDa DNA-binding subunit B [Tanacetum coccineum]|uniref:Replication protein A 70 kDa DNA-binding subunit B n=1 Tax=Tanacetum coccineum TaxID=301880 RepID=A0ABQ5HV29_9ASTR
MVVQLRSSSSPYSTPSLAKVKYFNDKPSVTNSLFPTKLFINENIPEILTFRQRYQDNDGYDEKNHAISLYSPVKKVVTIEEFFAGGIKKLVGSIPIVYAKLHKIHHENGWTYIGCKGCGSAVKEIDPVEARAKSSGSSSFKASGSSSSKANKSAKRFWWCKKHELIEVVVPKYKVIVSVIDDTGSASLLLFDDMIDEMVGIPCYKLKEKYGANAEDIFPEELITNIVAKRLLFRIKYTEYNINNNHHVYQVKHMYEDAEFIKLHKKDFIYELAKVKYFNDKPSVTNSLFPTKLFINENIPKILAFRQRYQDNDGYDEKNHAISLYSPVKKVVTIEEFFAGGIKKLVGSIPIVYAKLHKIHHENGWTYIGYKRCGSAVKEIDPVEARAKSSGSSSFQSMWVILFQSNQHLQNGSGGAKKLN